MPEIVEAIHKITYEVDDRQLQNVQQAIRVQIQELNYLNKLLFDIQKQIQQTGRTK
jgi:hypothetical protein